MSDLLLNLAARALVLGGLGWVLYVGLSILVQDLLAPTAIVVDCPVCEGEGGPCCSDTGKADTLDDEGASWDADPWQVVA
ncbi:hypothetical protein [Nocardia sp. NPDC059239]|uniref:hypothetical protein n=1 Tax=unclassified Nocardia TaxID=2637762 RepID=UPI003674CC14